MSKARFIPTKFQKKLKAQASRTSQNTQKKKKLKKSKTQPSDLREKESRDSEKMQAWAVQNTILSKITLSFSFVSPYSINIKIQTL